MPLMYIGSKISMASIKSADATTALKDEKQQPNNNNGGPASLGNIGGGPSKFIESLETESGTSKVTSSYGYVVLFSCNA